MAEVTLENVQGNLPLVDPELGNATPYFEDWLYRVIADLNTLSAGTVTDAANVGAGAGVYKELAATTLQLRSFTSSNASVTISQGTDEIDLVVAGSLPVGTVANSILTWSGTAWTELSEYLLSHSAGALTMQVEDSLGVDQIVGLFDADAESSIYYDGAATLRTAAVASGGAEANNTLTGAGWERVLTTSDLLTFGNWKTLYTDGSGVLTELALGATAGHVLTSNGAAAAPSWQAAGGGGGLTYFQDGTTWGEALYSTFVAFETDVFGIVVQGVDTDVQPRINFLDDDGGSQVGNIRATSVGFVVDNRRTSGPLLLRAVESLGSVVNLLDGDPDGSVELYYDATATLRTSSAGIDIADVTGGDPVLGFYESAWSNRRAFIQSNDITGLFIRSERISNNTWIQATDSSSVAHNGVVVDPDGAVDLYYDGVPTLATADGGASVFDNSGNSPFVGFYHDDLTTRNAFIIANTASALAAFRSEIHGATVNLQGEDALGTSQELVIGDPDGEVELYYDGSLKMATDDRGLVIYDTVNGTPSLYFRDAAGTTDVFRFQAWTDGHAYITNAHDAGDIIFRTLDHGSTSTFVNMVCYGESAAAAADSYVAMNYNGSQRLATASDGAVLDATDATLTMRDGGSNTMTIQKHDSGYGLIKNREHGGLLYLQGEDTATGATFSFLSGDPDVGVAFNGVSPVAAPTYTLPTYSTDRAPTVPGSITLSELADVVCTIIADLQANGLYA